MLDSGSFDSKPRHLSRKNDKIKRMKISADTPRGTSSHRSICRLSHRRDESLGHWDNFLSCLFVLLERTWNHSTLLDIIEIPETTRSSQKAVAHVHAKRASQFEYFSTWVYARLRSSSFGCTFEPSYWRTQILCLRFRWYCQRRDYRRVNASPAVLKTILSLSLSIFTGKSISRIINHRPKGFVEIPWPLDVVSYRGSCPNRDLKCNHFRRLKDHREAWKINQNQGRKRKERRVKAEIKPKANRTKQQKMETLIA